MAAPRFTRGIVEVFRPQFPFPPAPPPSPSPALAPFSSPILELHFHVVSSPHYGVVYLLSNWVSLCAESALMSTLLSCPVPLPERVPSEDPAPVRATLSQLPRLHLKIHLAHAHAKQNILQAGISCFRFSLLHAPSLHSLQTAIKSGRCVAQGQEEVRTLLEHKGNGNVELRRFLGCSVASLRLTASLPLPLPSPALPLPSVCSCGKKLPAELCCLLLGDLAHVRMQKRLQRFGLCFV